MMTVITAATSEAARAKLEDYRSYVSDEGALVLMSGWTGVDCELMDRLSRSPVRHKDFLNSALTAQVRVARDCFSGPVRCVLMN
jgi:hypothetical protein